MGTKSTFIKLDRSIEKWRWYKNGNTLRVFIHLLLNANVVSHDFENITIERGSLATSYESIGVTLNLTVRQVRTALGHLKATGTITTKVYRRFQVITIVNYDYYQSSSSPKASPLSHPDDSLTSPYRQQYNNVKNDKNEKNGKKKGSDFSKKYYDWDLPGVTVL